MSDIAEALGVSKKTLYQEIPSKDELVKRVMEYDMEEERQKIVEIGEKSEDAIQQMVETTIYLMKKMRRLSPVTHYDLQKYYGLLWKDLESDHLNFIYTILKKNIQWGKSTELYRSNIDPEIISRFFVHKASVAVDEVYFPLDTYERDRLLMQLISYHINGITTAAGVDKWRVYKKNVLNAQKIETE
jgi:AcrR family transcriptional regulator